MLFRQATIWIYGHGTVSARTSGPLPVVFVDGRPSNAPVDDGWHAVLLVAPVPGTRLEAITIS